jgi:hypothetical protein
MKHLTKESLAEIPEGVGIYKLYAKNSHGNFIPIQRFAATDNSGLLYLGRTTKQNLKKRIYNLLATSREITKTTNHSGGLKYRTNPIIRQTLDDHQLYFECEVCENPKLREAELLHSYSRIYGEYPPLNK